MVELEPNKSAVRQYYEALHEGDGVRARELFDEVAITDVWNPDRLRLEALKCGKVDEGDQALRDPNYNTPKADRKL